jgi:hypothetical protein
MILRTATFCCVLAATATLATRQAPDRDKLVGSWIVHYDRNDDVQHFPKAKRKSEAIRLFITKRGSNMYTAQLRRFQLAGSAYTKVGEWNGNLHTEGGGGHRKRIAFWSDPIAFAGGTLEIKGIWQRGKDKTDRTQERIQLLRFVTTGAADADQKKKDEERCDEEPDTDVLEDEPGVTNPDNPPPDPDPS